MQPNHEQLIVAFLRRDLSEVEAVYLFGSEAGGTAGAKSDVDVAFLPAAPITAVRRWELQQDLAVQLGRDVDLVDLLDASTVLCMQVVSGGRVLYEADRSAREAFEDYVFSAYVRLNEDRRAIVDDARRRGRVHA